MSVVVIGGLGYWVYQESSKPLVGQKIEDLGREHVTTGTEVDYNSNPPTSGPHYTEWVRDGVYDAPRDDRNLVHSLEHGYVIISYNCAYQAIGYRLSVVSPVFAHGIEEINELTPESTSSARLPGSFQSEACHQLVDQLITVYEKKRLDQNSKLIIVPRPNLDAKIALTAWDYLDKFDGFDESRIVKFIDAHRDFGPERTVE